MNKLGAIQIIIRETFWHFFDTPYDIFQFKILF